MKGNVGSCPEYLSEEMSGIIYKKLYRNIIHLPSR